MDENFVIPLRVKIYSKKYPDGQVLVSKRNAGVSDVTSFGEDVAAKFKAKKVLIQTVNGTWIPVYIKESPEDKLPTDEDFDYLNNDDNDDYINKYIYNNPNDSYDDGRNTIYDSIQIEDCQDCDIEFSKKKIVNKNFKDSKCDVIESDKSLRFVGKTEDVISTIAQAMGKAEDDVIEMIINKI